MCSKGITFNIQHAFEGSNVLSLANKITHDPVQPIPAQYSKNLFGLIQLLLQKDPAKRPSIREIL
jgi:serine/threonine protein kinase